MAKNLKRQWKQVASSDQPTRTMMPILVICEGESDEEFIHQLVNEDKRLKGIGVWSLLLPPHIDDANRDSAGVGGYTKRLQGLLTETGLETCKLIVVMADHDDPAKKLAEVKKGYQEIPSVWYPG